MLEVIRDSYRQQVQFDPEAEPEMDLNFGSSIDDWRLACDLVRWRQLGQALAGMWEIQATDAEWKAVLEPAKTRRLGDLCAFIASRAQRPTVRASRLLGSHCMTGGAFLALREALAQAGADVRRLKPSSPLAPYMDDYGGVILWQLAKLAPGRLPLVQLKSCKHAEDGERSKTLFRLAVAGATLLGIAVGSSGGLTIGPLFFGLMMLIIGLAFSEEKHLTLPGITNFRELVDCLRPQTSA
ncbi:MAG: hypothetical protein IPL70_01450 [Uliginosibacterium sp.]|nr:hypothetical protein [Uliginosibacterium sp.]